MTITERADRPAKRLYSRAAACEYLDKSATELDRMIRRGEILAKRDGRRVVIDVAELDRYIDRLPSLEPKRAAS